MVVKLSPPQKKLQNEMKGAGLAKADYGDPDSRREWELSESDSTRRHFPCEATLTHFLRVSMPSAVRRVLRLI